MKNVNIFLLLYIVALGVKGQAPNFKITFSEPLAVFEFVNNLSPNAPVNPFKKLFDSSEFNLAKYKLLIAEYDKLDLDYGYEYTKYPYAQKIGGSTKSLLKRNLIKSQTIQEFKIRSLGIIPNIDLLTLSSILTEFDSVYKTLIYLPYKEKFDIQLNALKNLFATQNITGYFDIGLKFYNSSWDNTIPFEMSFYPLPNSIGFTATAFFNNAESAIPSSLKDYHKLFSVMLHEIFHLLYDEQSLLLKQNIEKWFVLNPSKNSRYAFLLMNEALATALGNGYVYGKLNGIEDTAAWYRRKYTNSMAKKIYPLLKDYIIEQKSIDENFVANYIKIYDDNFSQWLSEVDNIMTDRYILSDNTEDFTTIDDQFPYRSMSQYDNPISEGSIEKMKQAPITKVVIVSKDNQNRLQLIKQNFIELMDWKPESQKDFIYSVFLGDKTYLIIINDVNKTAKDQILQLKKK